MSKRPDESEVIAFLDLETTGNRPEDRIIEVGVVLVDREIEVRASFSEVVRPAGWPILRLDMAPEVVAMHEATGLLDEVQSGRPMAEVDAALAALLRKHNGTSHVALAGSGVSHFDRRYIRAEMPLTDKRLSYWAYDTGAMRRFLRWWDIYVPEAEDAYEFKNHRALSDAYAAALEARAYRDYLKERAA